MRFARWCLMTLVGALLVLVSVCAGCEPGSG